jgi:hypothetical protein
LGGAAELRLRHRPELRLRDSGNKISFHGSPSAVREPDFLVDRRPTPRNSLRNAQIAHGTPRGYVLCIDMSRCTEAEADVPKRFRQQDS